MEVEMSSAVHISLNVSDLPRSTEFYRRFLGEPAKLKSDYVKFVAREPEIHLALQPGRAPARFRIWESGWTRPSGSATGRKP
jgi:catechol 2,3-dioxygenase-like lactoylglutathione lyase family enzyme